MLVPCQPIEGRRSCRLPTGAAFAQQIHKSRHAAHSELTALRVLHQHGESISRPLCFITCALVHLVHEQLHRARVPDCCSVALHIGSGEVCERCCSIDPGQYPQRLRTLAMLTRAEHRHQRAYGTGGHDWTRELDGKIG